MSALHELGEESGFDCPRCQGKMFWRQNRMTKSWFMGCGLFPQCVGSRNEDGLDSTIVNTSEQKRLIRLLKAAVLSSDDECLTFKESELDDVDNLELSINHIREENSYVITVKKR